MFVLLCSLLSGAFASPLAPSRASHVPGQTERAALHDALLQRVEDTSGQGGCLTGLVMELRTNWGLFTSDERERMTSVLAPFKADLFDDLPERADAGQGAGVPPPAGDPTTTCFGDQGDNSLIGAHFEVQWDTGTVSQSTAQGFLDDLEVAWTAEVEEQGWKDFAGADDYLMLVYIEDRNTGGAYTTISNCGGMYMAYIVAGKDAVSYGTWTDEMAAHEFNHALQFNYSYAPEFWWWEATATYVQSLVRDSTNWADYLYGYSDAPYIALGASSQSDQDVFWHMYGLSIFAHYLADHQGGQETVRTTWENSEGSRGQYTTGGQDMVEALGLDWLTTYTDFITKNVAMEYDQHRLFPSIDLVDHTSSFPASGAGDGKSRPQGYGQNYIRFDGGAGPGDLEVTFHGDADVDWVLVLAESDGSAVLTSVSLIVEGGEASFTFPDYADRDVYFVVSPLIESEDKYDYSWEAELVSAGGDTGVGDTGDGGQHVQDGEGVEVTGCGCATSSGAPTGALILGLLALAGTRRRASR